MSNAFREQTETEGKVQKCEIDLYMNLQRFADMTKTQVNMGGPSDSVLLYLLGSSINEILVNNMRPPITGGYFSPNVKIMTAIVTFPRESTNVTDP